MLLIPVPRLLLISRIFSDIYIYYYSLEDDFWTHEWHSCCNHSVFYQSFDIYGLANLIDHVELTIDSF